jgi:hypothetical protein
VDDRLLAAAGLYQNRAPWMMRLLTDPSDPTGRETQQAIAPPSRTRSAMRRSTNEARKMQVVR